MSKVLTGIPATPHNANVLTRSQQGPTWRKQAAPVQPRTPTAHAARGHFAGATRLWSALSPANQSQYRTLAAASGGRYATGFALFMALSITNAAGGLIGPPATYVEGGSITSASLTVDLFADMPLLVNTTNEAQDEVLCYFQPYARQAHYSFSKGKARLLPFRPHAGTETFIESLWPGTYGVYPPYRQRIVAWFQAINATTGITGPLKQFTFQMPNS